MLSFSKTTPSDAGAYICSAHDPRGGAGPVDSSPAYLGINPRRPTDPVIEPQTQTVDEGEHAKFRCYLPGVPDARISWRKLDGSALSSDAADNGRGTLTFSRALSTDAGAYICTAQDPRQTTPLDSQPAYLNVSPRRPGTAPSLMVDPPSQTVNENEPAQFKCWVPGVLTCELTWHKEYIGGPLPYGVYQSGGVLKIPRAQLHDAGNYICTASNQYGIGQSPPARLTVHRPPQPPRVDPPEMTVNDGDPARFRCWVPGDPSARLSWRMRNGDPIPAGTQENEGILNFPRARQAHAGGYVCTATDVEGKNPPMQSHEVRLNIREPKIPSVEPLVLNVHAGQRMEFRCSLADVDDYELHWRRADGGVLGYGVSESKNGILSSEHTRLDDAGEYICSAVDLQTEHVTDSQNVLLNVQAAEEAAGGEEPQEPQEGQQEEEEEAPEEAQEPEEPEEQEEGAKPAQSAVERVLPEVDPIEQTVTDGDQAQIICTIHGGQSSPHLKWRRQDGGHLPGNAQQHDGLLTFPEVTSADMGAYICTYENPDDGSVVDSEPATINVEMPVSPRVDPHEQVVNENGPIRIRCWVPGNPTAVLKWRKHGDHLPADAIQDPSGLLTIPRAALHDAGDYICSAHQQPATYRHGPAGDHGHVPGAGVGIDAIPARVNVIRPDEPPRYEPPSHAERPVERPVIDPPQQTVNEGDAARFQCHVPNDAGARIRWSFDRPDGALPPYAQDDGDTLTIARTDQSHHGDYYCIYDSPQGSLPSNPARLSVHQPGYPPHPEASPADQSVKTGESARFHCDANSDVPARVTWGYREPNGPLRGDVVQDGDDVIIRSADHSNAGEYICTATNQYGSGEAVPVRLHVTENEEPPTARVVPRVWNGKPGDRHQFRCLTTGVPPPQVSWTGPDGAQLPDDVSDVGGGVLEFESGRPDMNGDYTCTAVNIVGEASDHGSVNIGPSLTLRTTPSGPRILLTAGQPLEVKCEAFGEPDPEVEWLHDPGPERGDLPDDFKPVTISEQFIRHPSVGTGNAGVYTCKGSNSQATATKDIHVEVVETSRIATVAILGGSTQWLEPGSPAELICTATGNSLVDRIEWTKIDDELPPDVEDHNEPGILHFANFKSSDSGVYECRGYRNDEHIASATVTVHPTNGGPLGVARVEIDEPTIRVVNQGDSIVLKCSVHGGATNNGLHYEWALLRGGSLVRELSRENIFTIAKSDASNDFGVYRCEVEDDDGELVGAAYAALTIANGAPNNAQIVKFDEKSDATITCPVYAVPGAEVVWEKQDSELPDGAVTQRNKLIIKDFDDSATGTYICKVTVEGQQIEGYVTALIYVPDTIIQVLLEASSESVEIGDRAWFDCKVAGDPDAEITWSRDNNEELPDNAQVVGNRLLFVNVREDNGGLYKCHAETKEGPLETRTVLNVGGAGLAKRKRKHLHHFLPKEKASESAASPSRMHRGIPPSPQESSNRHNKKRQQQQQESSSYYDHHHEKKNKHHQNQKLKLNKLKQEQQQQHLKQQQHQQQQLKQKQQSHSIFGRWFTSE